MQVKTSTSTALVPVGRPALPAASTAGSCGSIASRRKQIPWLLVASIALAVAAALLGSALLGFAAVLPFLYLLPCLAMTAMCMKGMAKGKSDEAP